MVRQSQRGELMRDPFVQRAPDGSFRMVWTWSTGMPAVIGYSTSDNLVFWTEQRQLPVTAAIPAARNAWFPAMYYEWIRRLAHSLVQHRSRGRQDRRHSG